MKKYKFIVLLLLAAAVFPACDKPYIEYEEEENKDKVVVESSDDKSDSVDGDADYDDEGSVTDNGGNDNQDNEGSGDEFDIGDVVDVETFISTPIVNQIWLKGYIVGAATGANGKKRYDFEAPYDYDTAILLADTPDETDLEHVASVCLTSCSKKIREALNLKDHPENHGKVLSFYGFREVYLNLPGIKTIDAYDFSE